ncbi:DUF1289 domain-containing protein [Sulfuritalea sp.]|uniref:DUF1289 domain-containing protein n=1 Tax=Sulfuritalea sp. TaxID=2480090 RepID=UPI0025E5C50E|nr:DUF1289 domain-containing protein [Sulfuritalea sp.]
MSRRVAGSVAKAAVESPCINICKMEDGLCIGCFRTLDEIACWANVDDDGKRLILAAVAQRRRSTGGTATDEAA